MVNTENSQNQASRLIWVDVLKGLGILSVVVGHLFNGLTQDFIFLFHMPLFFFIGGFLYKKRANLKEYFQTKLIHLAIPYCSFLVVLYSKDLVGLAVNLDQFTVISAAKVLLSPIVGGQSLQGWTGVFWFVGCFFAVQQLFNLMVNRLSVQWVSILCFLMLLLSYLNSQFFPDLWLPLNINVVAAAIPFFFTGYLFKNLYEKKRIYLCAAIFLISYFSLFFQGSPSAYDMKYSYYGVPFVSFIAAMSMILLAVFIARNLAYVPFLNKLLVHLGSASMVIMYLHQPILFSMRGFDIQNFPLMFICAVVFPFIAYTLLSKHYFTNAIFLGNHNDYMRLVKSK